MNKAILLILLLSSCAHRGPIYAGQQGNLFIYRPIDDGGSYLNIRGNHQNLCSLQSGAFIVKTISAPMTLTITRWGPTGYSHVKVNPGDYIKLQDRSNFIVMDASGIKVPPEQARQEMIGLTQSCK